MLFARLQDRIVLLAVMLEWVLMLVMVWELGLVLVLAMGLVLGKFLSQGIWLIRSMQGLGLIRCKC